jgi:hypothetical protein
MDSIPVETLQIIISYLSKQDVLTAGLVCRAFHACTVRILFSNVTVWIQRQSLNRLVGGFLLSALLLVLGNAGPLLYCTP